MVEKRKYKNESKDICNSKKYNKVSNFISPKINKKSILRNNESFKDETRYNQQDKCNNSEWSFSDRIEQLGPLLFYPWSFVMLFFLIAIIEHILVGNSFIINCTTENLSFLSEFGEGVEMFSIYGPYWFLLAFLIWYPLGILYFEGIRGKVVYFLFTIGIIELVIPPVITAISISLNNEWWVGLVFLIFLSIATFSALLFMFIGSFILSAFFSQV